MSYNVIAIPNFKKEIKKLSKKFPSLKADFEEMVESLQINPEQGTPLGNHCYKIRLGITSKGNGKSGGGRVITCLKVLQNSVYLLSIYDKSKQDTITDNELKELLNQLPE